MKFDWSLIDPQDRLDSISNSLNPTMSPAFLERASDYILWSVDDGTLGLESRSRPWTHHTHLSLEAACTNPATGTSSDALLSSDRIPLQLRRTRPPLDRRTVLRSLNSPRIADPHYLFDVPSDPFPSPLHSTPYGTLDPRSHFLVSDWITLWTRIDSLEYALQLYDISTGRFAPDFQVRHELLLRLDHIAFNLGISGHEFRLRLSDLATSWTPFVAAQNRRELIKSRQDQYPLLDSSRDEPVRRRTVTAAAPSISKLLFDDYYPFDDPALYIGAITPDHFTPSFQARCIQGLQRLDALSPSSRTIDLRNPDLVRRIYKQESEIIDTLTRTELITPARRSLGQFYDHFLYYLARIPMTPELQLIRDRRLEGYTSTQIVEELSSTLDITRSEAYLSTIFTRKFVKGYIREVQRHIDMIEFLTLGRTVFKECSRCHSLYPRNSNYFNKRNGTSDLFYSYCKWCKKGEDANLTLIGLPWK